MTTTGAAIDRATQIAASRAPASPADDDAILILGDIDPGLATLVDEMADAGMTTARATARTITARIRTGSIGALVFTGNALRSIDFEALAAAIADQPIWFDTIIIAIDVDHVDIADRVQRLDEMTILVPIESPQDTRNAVNLARAALRVRRGQHRCRRYVETSEAAELAARQLAETFEARVEQRTAELAAALDVCSIASNRLTESDERNRAVIEMTDLILFTADATGQVTRIDDKFYVMMGYPRTQKLSIYSDKKNVHPGDRDRIRAAQIESVETGKALDYQYRLGLADGSHRWLHLRARPVVDDYGNVLRWNGTLADINDRRVAEERLSASEALHRHSTVLSDLIAWTATPDGQIETLPDSFFEKTGWCRDDMHGLGSAEWLIHTEDLRPVRVARFKTVRTGQPLDCEFRICHADGHYHWWRMRAVADRDDAGRVIRWYGSFKDIHELKCAEERLRESELRHRASIALSHLITFTLDRHGMLDSVDDPICRITGFSMAELLANAPDGICHPDDLPRLVRARDDAVETHNFDQTVRIIQSDATFKWWRLRSAPRWSAEGNIIGWFGTMEDVDQLVRAREALKSSEEIHRLSIELSYQIAWSADVDGKVDSVGEGLSEKLGIARDAWLAMTSAERVHPDDLDRLAAMHRDARQRRCSADYQVRMRHHDGSFRWWRGRYAPLLGADGEVIRWFGTFDDVNELVLAREALKASEELYRLSVELSGQIVWAAGADARITNVSQGLSDRLGISRNDWLAMPEAERVHPDDAVLLKIAGMNAVRDRAIADFRFRMRYGDGSFRWWRARAAPFFNERGEAIHWHGMMEDVDDLIQAENRLRESDERHRASIALSHLITFTLDANGDLADIDDRFCALTGLAMAELIGGVPYAICHPDDVPDLMNDRAVVADVREYDKTCRMRHADGQYKWWRIRTAARFDADDTIIGWYGTMEDVNLLVLAREALKASEEIHRYSIELSDLVVWSMAPDGTIEAIGDALFSRLGIERDVWMAMTSEERCHPDDGEAIDAAVVESVRRRAPMDVRVRLLCGDGSYRWWRYRCAPLFDTDGRILRWHGTMEDVHELHQAEEALQESDRRHRASIALSHLITFTLDARGQLVDIDDHIGGLIGLTIPEMLANGHFARTHPLYLEQAKRLWRDAAQHRTFDQTVPMRYADGTYKWWRMRAAARLDDDGATLGWYGTMEDVNLLVLAREALTASEELHRRSVELSGQVVWSAGPDGRIDNAGEALFASIGISREVWLAMSEADRVHPDDAGRLPVIRDNTLTGLTIADFRFRLRYGDGSYRWWRSRCSPLLADDGSVIRWHGMMEDVDDLYRAEEKLRESEERYRFAIQMSNLVTYTADADTRIVSMDDIAPAAIGFPIEEIAVKGSDFVWHPDHLPVIQTARAEALISGNYDQTCLMDNRDGTYRWWRSRATAFRDVDGKILRWFGTLENVDELKRAEEKLRESENRHRLCIGLSKLLTYTADSNAIILSIDDAVTEVTGIAVTDIVGTMPTSLCHPDDIEMLIEALLSAREIGNFECVYRISDSTGRYRWWRSRSRPYHDETGAIIRWYGTMEDIDELRQAEQRLRDSEELHRHSVELSNMIVWTATAKGRFINISPRIYKMLGLTREMTKALQPMTLVHPGDLAVAAAALQVGLNDGVPADLRLRLKVVDGSYRWWRLRSSPLRNEEGAIIRWYGTLEDVDELTRAAERLRDSEELHRFSVELSNQVVWTGTPEGRIESIGPRLPEKLGIDPRHLMQMEPRQLVHPDDFDVARMARRHSITKGVPADFEVRLLHGDNAYHWWRIRAAALRSTDGSVIRWYGTLEDVDELKRAGERLRETEELYRYTIELGEQIVLTSDAHGRVNSIGPRWTDVTGLAADAAMGDGLLAIMHPDEQREAMQMWAARVADGMGADFTCRLANAAGNYRWWRMRAQQRRDDDGAIIGWYGTLEDVDAVVLAEQQVRQLQAEMIHISRLNAMGTMASTIAHELNQPLAAVINYIGGSRRLLSSIEGPGRDQIAEAMSSAQDCALRASEIIRRVRQQVSRGGGGRGTVAAASLVQDARSIALISARELGIDVVVDLDPAVTTIHADAVQVQQILINLLRNAVEAVAGQPVRKIVVSTSLVGNYCAFAVNDSGPGVADAMVERLFEPFETSKEHGLGIGLSICRTIAESHGGKLDYKRSVLGGANFTILLPIEAPP